jgi:hypothetical protein
MATNNQVDVGLSGSSGSGHFAGTTSPVFTTPTLGAASATSISFSSTSGIIGSTTNDSAAAGSVGEIISSSIVSGSAVSLSTGTAADLTSISLTAGNWMVWGNIKFLFGTSATNISAWASKTSATAPDGSLYNEILMLTGTLGTSGISIPSFPLALSTTTTVYLSGVATFTGAGTFCGNIYAMRTR